MVTTRSTSSNIEAYKETQSKITESRTQIDDLLGSFKQELINNTTQLMQREHSLSANESISKVLGNLIIKFASLLQLTIAEDIDGDNASLEKKLFEFEMVWNKQLDLEGSGHLLFHKPRLENVEEKIIHQRVLSLVESIRAAKKIQNNGHYILQLLQHTQSVTDEFIETAEALQKGSPFRLQKNLNHPTLETTKAQFTEIEERLNQVVQQQYQLFSQPTHEIGVSLDSTSKDFQRLKEQCNKPIAELKTYLQSGTAMNLELEREKNLIIIQAKTCLQGSQSDIKKLQEKIQQYHEKIAQEKRAEVVKLNALLAKLKDFVTYNLKDLERASTKLQDLNRQIIQRSETILAIKQERKSNTSIVTIATAMHKSKKEMDDLINNLSSIYKKLERQDEEFMHGVESSMVEPISNLGVQIEEFRHAKKGFSEQKDVSQISLQKSIFDKVDEIIEHLSTLQKTWEYDKHEIIQNAINESRNLKLNIASQIEFLNQQNLVGQFDVYKIIDEEAKLLISHHQNSSQLLDEMKVFNKNLTDALQLNPDNTVEKTFSSFSKLLSHQNPEENIELALLTHYKLLETRKNKIIKLADELEKKLGFTAIDINYMQLKGLQVTQNKLSNYEQIQKQYDKNLHELNQQLDNLKLEQLDARILQLQDLTKLTAVFQEEIRTYCTYVEKNFDKLKQKEMKEKENADRIIWKKLSNFSDDEKAKATDDEKLIFLQTECKIYAEHLQKSPHNEIAAQKLKLVQSYQVILSQKAKPANEKIQQLSDSFYKEENIELLKIRRDSKLVSFFKAVASIIVPKKILYRIAGDEFMQHISPTIKPFRFFPSPPQEQKKTTEANSELRMSLS